MSRNEHLFRGRPCNTQRSHENQKLTNGRFQNDEHGNAFEDARYPGPHVRARGRAHAGRIFCCPLTSSAVAGRCGGRSRKPRAARVLRASRGPGSGS
jgi:hypothetical protein